MSVDNSVTQLEREEQTVLGADWGQRTERAISERGGEGASSRREDEREAGRKIGRNMGWERG